MIDRTFSAALTFCVLMAAALAIASTLFASPPAAKAAHRATSGLSASGIRLGNGPAAHAPVKVVQLPTVVITAKRATPIAVAQTDETRAATRALQ
jgi:di/tricarboxylate transporter